MSKRSMSSEQKDQLEALVDSCGLDLVLVGLASICAEKSDHVLHNWQDRALANAWSKAMTVLDKVATNDRILDVAN